MPNTFLRIDLYYKNEVNSSYFCLAVLFLSKKRTRFLDDGRLSPCCCQLSVRNVSLPSAVGSLISECVGFGGRVGRCPWKPRLFHCVTVVDFSVIRVQTGQQTILLGIVVKAWRSLSSRKCFFEAAVQFDETRCISRGRQPRSPLLPAAVGFVASRLLQAVICSEVLADFVLFVWRGPESRKLLVAWHCGCGRLVCSRASTCLLPYCLLSEFPYGRA